MKKEMVWIILGILVVGGIGFSWYQSQAPQRAIVPPAPNPSPIPPVPPASPNPSQVPPAPVAPAQVSVDILNYQYVPKTITVKVGTTVTWTNRDTVPHTVTVTGANGGPDSTLFRQNETYSYTFDKAGTFDYYCKPHPYMKGSVVVTN